MERSEITHTALHKHVLVKDAIIILVQTGHQALASTLR